MPDKLWKAASSEITVSIATSNLGNKLWISLITNKALSTSVESICNSEYKKYPAPRKSVSKTIWKKSINFNKLN